MKGTFRANLVHLAIWTDTRDWTLFCNRDTEKAPWKHDTFSYFVFMRTLEGCSMSLTQSCPSDGDSRGHHITWLQRQKRAVYGLAGRVHCHVLSTTGPSKTALLTFCFANITTITPSTHAPLFFKNAGLFYLMRKLSTDFVVAAAMSHL